MAIVTRFSATKNIIRKWFLQRTRTLSHSPYRSLVRIQMESKEEEKNEDGKQNKIAFLLLFDASTHFPTHSSHSSCAQLRYLFSNYIINLMICDRFLIGFLLLESIPIWRKIKCYICILSHAGAYKNTHGLSLTLALQLGKWCGSEWSSCECERYKRSLNDHIELVTSENLVTARIWRSCLTFCFLLECASLFHI